MEAWMFRPPVLVGERVVWLGSGSGLPQGGVVRWIGKLPQMGPDWTVGLELDKPLPYGGIDGTWGNRYLFTCEPKHGLLVPITKTIREADLLSWHRRASIPHDHGPESISSAAPQPPARHKAPTSPPEPPARKPVTSRPRPAARRKKLLLSTGNPLSVIPEPAKESDCSEDNSTLRSRSKSSRTPFHDSLRSVNTYRTCKSGEFSDYCQWYDVSEDEYDFQDCKSEFYEPIEYKDQNKCDIYSVIVKCEVEVEGKENIESRSHGGVQVEFERMSEFKVKSECSNLDDDSSFEDAVTAVPHTPTGSSSRREKGTSGFFSFLRWFRKGKDDSDDENDKNGEFVEGAVLPPTPSSVRLIRTQSSSCGSIDTLFSTATVNSFSFVSPTSYRPYGTANFPEKRIALGPDTDTYRNRLRGREKARELDKNLTLKKKYNLFGSDSQLKSIANTPNPSPLLSRKQEEIHVNGEPKHNQTSSPGSSNSTFGRKKRRAPPPPPDVSNSLYNDYSLPSSWSHKNKGQSKSMGCGDAAEVKKSCHRRTVSESFKDKKAGAYCHVKGKRKAPLPPIHVGASDQHNSGTLEKLRSQFTSLGRKKRPAPQPPPIQDKPKDDGIKRKKDQETQAELQAGDEKSITKLSPEEKERLIANISKLKAHANRKSMGSPPSSPKDMHLGFRSPTEHVVCNDSLKLERGVLKPNKEMPKMEAGGSETKPAPVSPRPWYKRSLSKETSIKREIFKSLEKKKDREKEKDDEWMPEVGFPRTGTSAIPSDGNSTSSTTSKFNIFSRLDKSDEKKREGEKRKSQVSMLANISELDREAAEIVQKEQAREQALLAAHDAKFYSYPDVPGCNRIEPDILRQTVDEPVAMNVEVPKRSSARELISLFNAIGNVTKVTVNSAFFSKDSSSSFFSKEGIEKRFSFMGENVRTTEERVFVSKNKSYMQEEVTQKRKSVFEFNKPSVGSPSAQKKLPTMVNGTAAFSEATGVTIEEVGDDQEASSRVQAMYEANRSRRHHSPSPSIPTIAEQSESTTPASTIDPSSNRNSIVTDTPADTGPEALQRAKRLTIWACPRCTLENPRWKLTCDACGRWRPSVPDEKIDRSVPEEPTKIQDPKTETKANIDWEEELKRYFPSGKETPKQNKTDSKNDVQVKRDEIKNIAGDTNDISVKTGTQNQAVANCSENNEPVQILRPKNIKDTKNENLISNNVKDGKTEAVISKDTKSAVPSTFIGGRTKQDEAKQKAAQIKAAKVSAGTVVQATAKHELPLGKEPDIAEVRKARLAFFKRSSEGGQEMEPKDGNKDITKNRPNDQNITKSTGKSEVLYTGGLKLPSDENEKQKLKEMLKEMKDSLPKCPKKTSEVVKTSEVISNSVVLGNSDRKINGVTSVVESDMRNVLDNSVSDGHQQGAIKKTRPTEKQNSLIVNSSEIDVKKLNKSKATQQTDSDKVEALFITTKTVYEDIKVKKTNIPKPLKVSTSVQTSSVVRKVTSTSSGAEVKLPQEKQESDVALPVTVEELSTTGAKDGVLCTSLGKQVQHTRTFELIRARDFATIEATKRGNEPVAVHLYANLPPSPVNLPSAQQHQQPQGSVGSHGVFTRPQPSSPLSDSKWSSSERGESESREVEVRQASGVASPSLGAGTATSEVSSYSMASIGSGSEDNSEVERLTAQLTLPKGLAEFKADLQASLPEQNMNTLAVNRLLRRLEAAIAGGQHHTAAGLARDLARLKISCSVTRQRRSLDSSPASITVDMYVEDKVSHQGPIPLQVTAAMTVAQLKQLVEQEFEIPSGVQRWILGKMLAADDTKTLAEHNVTSNGCPMFLYLVAPDGEQEETIATTGKPAEEPEEAIPEPPPPNKGDKGGWYYNHDEDHYSFCEDTESELSEDDEASNVVPAKEPEKPPIRIERDKIIEEEEEDEESESESEEEPALIPASQVIIHERPVVMEPRPVLRAIQPTASRGASPQVGQPQSATGTLKLGWKCPTCTLVNSPTRPGCAACTTERPLRYVVPVEYRANEQELERMQREQQLETQMHQAQAKEAENHLQHYQQLVHLDNTELVPNGEPFDCSVCLSPYGAGEGVVLRECLHSFCRACLVNTVQFNEEAEVKCPYRDADYACNSVLQEREIKALVPPNVYEKHLAKSVAQAENKIGNAFHCKTPDCRGWCIFEDNVNEFRCPVCRIINCLTCQAIHDGINCKQYQEQVQQQSETNAEARRTKEMLEEMVVRGEAMACPTCQVVLMKKWGCDWLRCSMCKTEICWVTRGPRWGPGGKGDTTGGCQCGLNGVKCHPRCNYCH